MKYAIIKWRDSRFSSDGWVDVEDASALPLAENISVGILVKRDRNKVILALSAGLNIENYSQTLAISLKCIMEQTYIELPTIK